MGPLIGGRGRLRYCNTRCVPRSLMGQPRSFGDVGSMSGLPESGRGSAICECALSSRPRHGSAPSSRARSLGLRRALTGNRPARRTGRQVRRDPQPPCALEMDAISSPTLTASYVRERDRAASINAYPHDRPVRHDSWGFQAVPLLAPRLERPAAAAARHPALRRNR